MAEERSRDRSLSAESQPKFPGCSHFRRRNDNHLRCQQCRLNEGQPLCTQDRPCLACKDWLPEAWAAQAKANAQRNRRKAAAAAKAAKKASEETMDDSVEIHAPEEAIQLPSKGSKSEGSSKTKWTKTKATTSESSPWLPASRRWDGPALTGRTAAGLGVQSACEDTGTTNDRILRDISWHGVAAPGERASGPGQVPRAVPAPGGMPSPAVSPRRRTPVRRPLPLDIIIILRAIVDPFHQLHLEHLPTAGLRPVTRKDGESADRTGQTYVTRRDVKLSPKSSKPPEKRTIPVVSSPARQVHVESAPEVPVPAPVADGLAGADPAAGNSSDTGGGPTTRDGTATGNGTATGDGSDTGDGPATGDGAGHSGWPSQWRPSGCLRSWVRATVWWTGRGGRPSTPSNRRSGRIGRTWNPGSYHARGWTSPGLQGPAACFSLPCRDPSIRKRW